jgi:hypothetical protein
LFKESRIEEVFNRHQGTDDMATGTSTGCPSASALREKAILSERKFYFTGMRIPEAHCELRISTRPGESFNGLFAVKDESLHHFSFGAQSVDKPRRKGLKCIDQTFTWVFFGHPKIITHGPVRREKL